MSENKKAFEQAAAGNRESLVSEMVGFLNESKKWWLLPILLAFLAVGALVLLTGTPAAPFIYTLF
jgi:hypothetical protein